MKRSEMNWTEGLKKEVNIRTTILVKNKMIGLLSLKTTPVGGVICRFDPREIQPAMQVYEDPKAAEEWFLKSLKTSQKNGWRVIYDGLPIHG